LQDFDVREGYKTEIIMIKILLIEDDATMVSLLKMLLSMEGYQVVTLSSGDQDIIDLTNAESPDLLLLDVHLGQQNGLEVIKKLRKLGDLKKIKVIMTSGLNLGEKCMKAGADEFILKPYMPDELLDKIKNIFPNAQNG
jgi:DNA-binding response OmpR family regulator